MGFIDRLRSFGSVQNINLSRFCSVGNIIHEIGHTVGLYHEQSRCDRNSKVTINWQNIDTVKQGNFWRHCLGAGDVGGYDFGSIMHYGPFAFSKNGKATIVSKVAGKSFGLRGSLSSGDISTVNTLYPAPPSQPPPPSVVEQITFQASTLLANITGSAISSGNYKLRCERGGKRLDVKSNCGSSPCKVQLWSSGDTFHISKSEGIGYRIKRSNKYLQVNLSQATANGAQPNLRGWFPVPQQDWLFYKVGPNRYVIRNVLTGKALDARNSCTGSNGCKVQQWKIVSNDLSQVWKLEKQ